MKMPEGWKRIRDCQKLAYCLLENDRIELTELLKEMAEALEMGTTYENCPPLDCGIYGHNEMRAALKKFKEWK